MEEELLQVRDGGGEAEGRHDLGSDGDVVAVLTGHAVGADAEAADDGAELAVVHIHGTLPGDALRIDAEGVALENVIVQHGCDQVVRSADGVEVTGEVEVDVLHRDDLCPAAAGSAALDAEDRSQGRLAECEDGVLSNLSEAVCEADRSGGLAFSGRGRSDGGDEDELSVRILVFLQELVVDLCLVVSVELQILFIDPRGCGDLCDLFRGYGLRDLNVRLVFHDVPPLTDSKKANHPGTCPDGRLSMIILLAGAPAVSVSHMI